MRLSPLIMLLVGLTALPVVVSAHQWTTASDELAAAQTQLSQTAQTINRINDLRSRQQLVESHEKPQQAIIAQVNAALAAIGADQSALAGVTPLGDEPYLRGTNVGSSPYRTQSVQVSLREMSVRDAARFLQYWRRKHPIWRPTQIQLTHGRGRGDKGNRFNLTLTLRAVYLADGPPSTGT